MSTVSCLHAADGSMDPAVNAAAHATIKENYVRPDDAAYTAILRGVVRNCVDVLVIDEDSINLPSTLMGHRVNEPWKGHWHPSGGAQVPGDSYGQTGALHLKRDLGLIVDPERLQFISSASFPWSTSAQGVPCHMNGVLMGVLLSKEELSQRTMPPKGDFAQSKFFPLVEITTDNGFHPAIAFGARVALWHLVSEGRLSPYGSQFFD